MRSELWHEVRVAADRLENGTGTDAEFYDAYDAFRKCRADELSAEQRWSWAEQCGRLSAGEPPLPDPTPDEQALAEILWDGSGESIGWCDAFKHAQAIIAAGFHRNTETTDKIANMEQHIASLNKEAEDNWQEVLRLRRMYQG